MKNARTTAALAIASISCLLATIPVAAKDLTYSSYAGPRHAINEKALPPWFEQVKKQTDGSINWQIVTGGQLISGRETVAGVRDNIADAGMVVPAYAPAALPAIATLYSTLVFGDDVVAAGGAVLETLLLNCPDCKAELKRNNAVAIAGYALTPFKLMCTTPVTSMDDLKGKKVRASGSGVTMMDMAGATPVAMNPADGATAMQRGTIDCVLGAVSWMQSYGYQDVAHDVLDYPMGMMGPVLTGYINRDTWDALSEKEKKSFIDAAPMLDARGVIDAYYRLDRKVIDSAKERKIKFFKPTEGRAGFDKMIEAYRTKEREATIKKMKSLGLKDPGSIIDAYDKNLAKWRKLSPDIGHDVDKFAAVLKTEIYDKIDINDL